MTLHTFLRKRASRPVSFTLALLLLSEVLTPTAAMALTAGPSQPEVQSFEPVSTSDMVDVFSGNFKYNIPLLDVEGYPVNIAYSSEVSTDQEASWVGLGWNLNIGSVNRSMRGIPDDFKGDVVKKEMNIRPNRTFGINAGIDFELFGKEKKQAPGTKKGKKFKLKPSVGVGINYNNYTGFGVDLSIGVGISAGVPGKSMLDAGLGLHSNAASGLDISPNLSFSNRVEKEDKAEKSLTHVNSMSGAASGAFNTRAGLRQLSFNASHTKGIERSPNANDNPDAPTGSNDMNPEPAPNNAATPNSKTEASEVTAKGRGAGGTINFGLQSYVPGIGMPMINNSVALSVKFSTHLWGTDADIKLGGYYSSQVLSTKSKQVAAYGYMNAEDGEDHEDAMLDFNREKDASFSRTTRNLPLTNFTYDVFNVSGQGIGGTFRPFRGDVGHVFDARTDSKSDSYSLGAELGGGNLFKLGVDVNVTDVNSTSGKWTDQNEALDFFNSASKQAGSAFEPCYFKQVGEKSLNQSNLDLYDRLQGEDAYGVRILQGSSNQASGNSNLPNMRSKKNLERSNYDGVNAPIPTGQNKLTERQKRLQMFQVLTKSEASVFGLQKDLYNGTGVKNCSGAANSEMRLSTSAAGHHISEISVTNVDGARYYYGLPSYNIKTRECSFNISDNNGQNNTDSKGLISYTAQDASTDNQRGIDNMYNMTELPAYAYSYLLTAVVSADYVDQNNNGPDDADIGTYTKFHYQKSYNSGEYKWRMPVDASPMKANFSENSKSNTLDNTANYSYGEKELWYLDEIETKNYIARFTLSDRKDGFGVTDESGTISYGTTASKKIDKIELFVKRDYLANPSTAVPVKTVHFVYTYDLCTMSPKLPNNSGVAGSGSELSNAGGKLTLKQVYFTYGKSSRARFNRFDFTYANNPNYHGKAYDRWGNYKPVIGAIDYAATQPLTNPENPYVEQNKTTADANASAWTISKIALPSGGEINIEYEADEYAFVQNMPAGQMFKVLGTSNTLPTVATGNGGNTLYSASGGNSYLIVDLLNATDVTSDADFIKYYLKDLNEGSKQMFFKFLVNLTNSSAPTPNFYEYVSGYADIAMSNGKGLGGLIYNTNGTPTGRAWIKLQDVSLKNKGNGPFTNPVTRTAIQFARLNHGNVVWGAPYSPPEDIEEALKQLAEAAAGSLKTMVTGFKNPNKALFDKDYCKEFIPAKSFVRLYNPTGKRLGGGNRVKRLYISDRWTTMTSTGVTGQMNSIYGQEYDYSQVDEYGRSISSGVAAYEPMIGIEENSMKQPTYLGKNKWAIGAPDDRYYVEGPFGESFYPSPSVGYSKVKVSSLMPANTATKYRTGYKVYEFYTAKDYPTITRHTPIMPKQFRSPLKSVVKIASRDLVTVSQGYVVMTNDMHGKPKAEYDFAEGKTAADKETHFYYKTKGGGYKEPSQVSLYSDASYSGNQLENACSVINPTGGVVSRRIGIDFDAIADFRESETTTNMINAQINVATFLIGVVPAIVPTIHGSVQFELSRFRSAVLTKVVNQYGVQERTVVRQDQSIVATESVAFDSETGDALVTKTTNNFEDAVYGVKYPAYWAYDNMGGAYKNSGIVFQGASLGNGAYNIYNTSYLLNVGDELMLVNSTTSKRVWVCAITAANTINLMDENGMPVTDNPAYLKVIRSAKRNQYGKQMATLTCLNNPVGSGALLVDGSSKVLDAKGVTYSDNWQMHKGFVSPASGNNCVCSVSPLGTALINHLKALFNNPCNGVQPANGFFNGSLTSPVAMYQQQINYLHSKQTGLWVDAGILIPQTPMPGVTGLFPPFVSALYGFSAPAGYPAYNNYNFTSAIHQFLPSSNHNGFIPYFGYPLVAGWLGSDPNTLFNGTNIMVGAITSNVKEVPVDIYVPRDSSISNNHCTISFEFPNLTPTLKSQLISHFNGLPATTTNPSNKNIDLVPAATQNNCAAGEVLVDFVLKTGSTTILIYNNVKIKTSCMDGALLSCNAPNQNTPTQCGKLVNDKVNPFVVGIKGNYREQANYAYLTSRVQSITNAANGKNTNVRGDGYYSSFSQLFSASGTGWIFNGAGTGTSKWVKSGQSTLYDQFGTEIERVDALGRYTSALYGYNDAMPIAIASNARLQEIAYDGFEDYDFYPTCNREHHFDFYEYATNRNSSESHSGKFSLRVPASTTLSQNKTVVNTACQNLPGSSNSPSPLYPCSYYLKCYDFIKPFTPVSYNPQNTATDYVVSYWIKEAYSGNKPLNYTNGQLTVTQSSGAAFATKDLKRSAVIDGWQRVEYIFTIPNGYSGAISVNLINNGGTDVYFDDLRLHPASSSLKAFVYHPNTLRYVAALDENNFATFYEYDEQGNLVRIKKETERGIMTLQESKTHYAN